MRSNTSSPQPSRRPGGGGLSVQELKQMTALRMSQQAQSPIGHPQGGYVNTDNNNRNTSSPYSSPHTAYGRSNMATRNVTAPPEDVPRGRHARAPRHHGHHSPAPHPAGPQGGGRHGKPDSRSQGPQESSMPHGLTVQELKELTRIRLEREALDRRNSASPAGTTDSPVMSETSSTGYHSDPDNNFPNKPKSSPTTYFIPGRPYPGNLRNPQPSVLSKPNLNSTPYPEAKSAARNINNQDVPLHYHGQRFSVPGGMSDTSSTVSVSSGSTDGASERFAPPVPGVVKFPPSQMRSIYQQDQLRRPPPVQIADNASKSSTMGSVLREILTVDTASEAVHAPPPPPEITGLLPTGGGVMSPRSLKHRPELAVECPEEIRRRSRSDSLAYEMAEAVLGTPPGSPVQPAINRKRMSGTSATLMFLAGAVSPPSSYSAADLSVSDDNNFFKRDGKALPPTGAGEDSSFFSSLFSRRKGSGSINADGLSAGESFFPRRNSKTNTAYLKNLFQDLASEDTASPPKAQGYAH